MGAVEPLALEVLDADRAARIVEQYLRRERVQPVLQAIGSVCRDLSYPFARPDTLVILRGQRRIPQADGIVRHHPPVVRVQRAVKTGTPVGIADGDVRMSQCRPRRFDNSRPHVPVLGDRVNWSCLRLEPTRPTMTARISSQLARELLVVPVLAPFDALEVVAHPLGAP